MVTISGSGFGNKPSAAPALWDTVDNHADLYSGTSNGGVIPTGSSYPFSNTFHNVYLDRSSSPRGQYSGDDMRYMTSGNGSLSNPSALGGGNPPKSLREIYVRYRSKFEVGPVENVNNSAHKFMRIWAGGANDLRITWNIHGLHIGNYNAGATSAYTDWDTWNGEQTGWNIHEIWINLDKNFIHTYVNGKILSSITGAPSNYLTGTHPSGLRVAQLGWDPAHGSTAVHNQKQWLNDIYIDSSPARVILSDAARWRDVRKSEIQIPKTWGTTSISINLERRIFESIPYDDLYLYVVAPDGSVNGDGFPIRCSVCPSPPTAIELR
ncbi:MAG: hypothetical protein WED00_11470 [Aquisalimonadaceae bacterium]